MIHSKKPVTCECGEQHRFGMRAAGTWNFLTHEEAVSAGMTLGQRIARYEGHSSPRERGTWELAGRAGTPRVAQEARGAMTFKPGDRVVQGGRTTIGTVKAQRGHQVDVHWDDDTLLLAPRHESAAGKVGQTDHARDEHCTVDPETGCCPVCGVEHVDRCPGCGRRAFHDELCSLLVSP